MPLSEASESHGSHEHNVVENNRYRSLHIGSQARELFSLLSAHKGEIVSLEEIQKCIGQNYKNAKEFSTQLTRITHHIRCAIADDGLDIRRVYGQGIVLFDADGSGDPAPDLLILTPLESAVLAHLISRSPDACTTKDIFLHLHPEQTLPCDYRKHVGNFIAGIRRKQSAWMILSQQGSHVTGYRAISAQPHTAARTPTSPSTQD